MYEKVKIKINKGSVDIGTIYVLMFILIAMMSAFVIAGGQLPTAIPDQDSAKASSNKPVIIQLPSPQAAKGNLQLYTFSPITPTIAPTPLPTAIPTTIAQPPFSGSTCPLDDIKPSGSSCQCIDSNATACPSAGSGGIPPSCGSGFPMALPPGSQNWFCVSGVGAPGPAPAPPAGCYAACIGKPVIYLYPTKPTIVSVAVQAPGKVVVSDPLYPQGGWKNVLANPDGKLLYKGKNYKELFYETLVNTPPPMPATGLIIATKDIEPQLLQITDKLGLLKPEQQEFLDYWVPIVKNMHTPYIFFSILPEQVKEAVDHVDISPKPDTRIEFIAYFKPLQYPIAVTPLALPQTPPIRKGFTEVEWGGTIGK